MFIDGDELPVCEDIFHFPGRFLWEKAAGELERETSNTFAACFSQIIVRSIAPHWNSYVFANKRRVNIKLRYSCVNFFIFYL